MGAGRFQRVIGMASEAYAYAAPIARSRAASYARSFISPWKGIYHFIRHSFSQEAPESSRDLPSTIAEAAAIAVEIAKSKEVVDSSYGVWELRGLPRAFYTAFSHEQTKKVMVGSLSIFAFGMFHSFAIGGSTWLFRAYMSDFAADALYYVAMAYLMRAMAPKLLLENPLYNISLRTTLTKDLLNGLVQEIEKILKTLRYRLDMEDAFSHVDLPAELTPVKKNVKSLFYKVLSMALARIFLDFFADKELASKFFSGEAETFGDIANANIEKIFAKHFSEENIQQQVNKALELILLEYDYVTPCNFLKGSLESVKLKDFLEKASKRFASLFTDDACKHFIHDFWHSDALRLLRPILPSKHFHSQQDSSIKDSIYEKIIGPVSYFICACISRRLESSIPMLPIWGIEALITGDLLLRQKTRIVGMTAEEGGALFRENKYASFALGCAMLRTLHVINVYLSRLPGGSEDIVSLAVYYPIFQLFSVMVMLKSDSFPNPVPKSKEEASFDPLGLTRAMAKSCVDHTGGHFIPHARRYYLESVAKSEMQMLEDKKERLSEEAKIEQTKANEAKGATGEESEVVKQVLSELVQKVQIQVADDEAATWQRVEKKGTTRSLLQRLNEPKIQALGLILLGSDVSIKSLDDLFEAFATIPALNFFIKMYGRSIVEGMKNVETVKASFAFNVVKRLLPVISFVAKIFSDNVKTLVKLIGSKNVQVIIDSFREFVEVSERYRISTLEPSPVNAMLQEMVDALPALKAREKLRHTVLEESKEMRSEMEKKLDILKESEPRVVETDEEDVLAAEYYTRESETPAESPPSPVLVHGQFSPREFISTLVSAVQSHLPTPSSLLSG